MKPFLSISISTLAVFFVFAFDKYQPCFQQETAQNEVSSVVINIPAEPKTAKIWVENTTDFYEGETIDLHFAGANPPYLGIVDPEGHFFYLVFPGENAMGELTPLVESKHFAALKNLKINTRSLRADPYIYGVETKQAVFTKTGNYTFIMGENLHIDEPDFLENVAVRYVHAARPNPVSPNVAMN